MNERDPERPEHWSEHELYQAAQSPMGVASALMKAVVKAFFWLGGRLVGLVRSLFQRG